MYKETHKIILIGDDEVGKTTLVSKCLRTPTSTHYVPTIGVDLSTKIIPCEPDYWVKLSIWDTSGQRTYRSIIRTFFKNVAGCIVVYDVTNRTSFDHVTKWVDDLHAVNASSDVKVMLVGTKTDLYGMRQVSPHEGRALAAENDWLFHELGSHAESDRMFVELVKAIPKGGAVEGAPVTKNLRRSRAEGAGGERGTECAPVTKSLRRSRAEGAGGKRGLAPVTKRRCNCFLM